MREVVLALALLFCADVAIDAFDSDCLQPEQACHTCLCQTHALTQAPAAGERIAAPAPRLLFPVLETYSDRFTDKSVFQPPKNLA